MLKSLAILMLYFLPQVASSQVPESCQVCSGKMAFGEFQVEASLLRQYSLPAVPIAETDFREDPWVFELTVNVDGKPCSVELKSGPETALEKAVAQKIAEWRFTAWRDPRGSLHCYQSKVSVYVRRQNDRLTLVVPGINGPL